MKINFVFLAALTGACALQAQMPASHIAESKQRFGVIKNNVIRAAEAMPEEHYAFKPTPDIRSFGELMAHVADAQANICGAATGQRKPVNAASKKTKAELVAALKESAASCEAGFDATTEANAVEPVSMGQMKTSRLGLLEYNNGHDLEEYGYMAVYLRMKGVVPPTSAGPGR
jgi:uncharacterized damage-inducible protein DinB